MFSEEYKNLLTIHYEKNPWSNGNDKNGVKFDLAKFVLSTYNPKSIFDFGCGQNIFLNYVSYFNPRIETYGYDLGVPKYSEFGHKQYELLTSFDVLEHVETEYVDETLKQIESRFTKYAHLEIATTPAKKSFIGDFDYSDVCPSFKNKNMHLTVKPSDWWLKKIEANMPNSTIEKTYTEVHDTRKHRTEVAVFVLKK